MRRSAGFLAAALVGIGASACGGVDKPTLAQLRSRATLICFAASQQSARIVTPTWNAGSQEFLKHGIGVLAPELRALRLLTPPTGAEEVYANALTAFSGELGALSRAVEALAQSGDPVLTFKALQHRLSPLEARADDAWQALQIPACVGT